MHFNQSYEEYIRLMHQSYEMHRQRELYESHLGRSSVNVGIFSSGGGSGIPSVESQQSVLHYWLDGDSKQIVYFIFNYETKELTPIKTLNILNSIESIYPIVQGSFLIYTFDSESTQKKLILLSLNGEVTWSDDFDVIGDMPVVTTLGKYAHAVYSKSDKWYLQVFDKNDNRYEWVFDNYIFASGDAYDNIWKRGFIIKEIIYESETDYKYHIVDLENNTLSESEVFSEEVSIRQYAFAEKFVLKFSDRIEVRNANWEILATAGVSIDSISDFSFLGENGSFVLLWLPINKTCVAFYLGEINQFEVYDNYSDSFSYYIGIDRQKIFNFPNHLVNQNQLAQETGLVYFYQSDGDEGNSIYRTTDSSSLFYPIWSRDESLRQPISVTQDYRYLRITENGENSFEFFRSQDNILVMIPDYENAYGYNYLVRRIGFDGSDEIIDTGLLAYWDPNENNNLEVLNQYRSIHRTENKTFMLFQNSSDELVRILEINADGSVVENNFMLSGEISSYINDHVYSNSKFLIILDPLAYKTYVYNLELGGLQLIDEENNFDTFYSSSDFFVESGLRETSVVIASGTNMKYINQSVISDPISIDGLTISDVKVFERGFVVYFNEDVIRFYSSTGNLIHEKELDLNDQYDSGNSIGRGLRCSISVYIDSEAVWKNLIFDGISVQEISWASNVSNPQPIPNDIQN